jgi:hypothetical protein
VVLTLPPAPQGQGDSTLRAGDNGRVSGLAFVLEYSSSGSLSEGWVAVGYGHIRLLNSADPTSTPPGNSSLQQDHGLIAAMLHVY